MSRKRQLVKTIKKASKKPRNNSLIAIKKQIIWLLRTFFVTRRRQDLINSGFVLPTVAMVGLVVVLLTTAILFRSFERSKNATNVRVNETVLNAAAPAVDRARAKLDALFEDPTLPRGTPSDSALYDALKKDKYRLGDETRLKLAYNFNATAGIQTDTVIENDETLKTAWKFAVDTDNNGKKDSYVLYGIYFRSPSRNSSGQYTRKRSPLDARTPPMDDVSSNSQCSSAAGFSSLVGNSSWYKLQSGNLGKSFFVYTVNVPITQSEYNGLSSSIQSQYEAYKGNKGFVALEFQQDRVRIPLPYNAVWYENDLEITSGTDLYVNGRIHTNGNLLVGGSLNSTPTIAFRQVSSKVSCFYNEENGQVSVGGNVGTGSVNDSGNRHPVTIDLYQGFGNGITTESISSSNKSTSSTGGNLIGFNDTAYNERIARMKTDGIAACTTCTAATTTSDYITAVAGSSYPSEVKQNFAQKVSSSDDIGTAKNVLADQIEIYLRNRTRRVPFVEVPGTNAAAPVAAVPGTYSAITASLDPPDDWRKPVNASNQFIGATSVTINPSDLKAIYPNLQKQLGIQKYLGDRIRVGNNLPAKWFNGTQYVGSETNQLIKDSSNNNVNWTSQSNRNGYDTNQRWRNTQIQAVADLGLADRNGFWEEKAAEYSANPLDSVGGVRIVTGAGIYVDDPDVGSTTTGAIYDRPTNSFLPDPPDPTPSDTNDIPVWPDTMPMSSPADSTKKGDLLMRATAVYHYAVGTAGKTQQPIACVSSYYNPTDAISAKNKNGLPWNADTNGKSNNGVVYSYPSTGRDTAFTSYEATLRRQARLRFPNGRWANEPLKKALSKITGTTLPTTGLQMEDYSAIDTAICALTILSNESNFLSTTTDKPSHGAIKEATFLDGREIKQISTPSVPTTYTLDLEQRQPFEVRVTDIDLGSLASTAVSGTRSEYMLPYSGIIYATRDDALLDASDSSAESELLSPTDFKLDSTRRPNGIRLINGATLARDPSTNQNNYISQEKGLILVTNLPAYIKGKFNLHRYSVSGTGSTSELEEFTVAATATNFYDRGTGSNGTAETKFACRIGRTGCSSTAGNGDYWRPATIIADSMTLLSGDNQTQGFKDGYRTDGDYDLNNNTGIQVEQNFDPSTLSTSLPTLDQRRKDRLKNGFWENNFVTSANWWNASNNYPTSGSGSYLLNGITPIQRRINSFPEYLMEVCPKLPVETCGAGDWYVNPDPATSLKASSVVGQAFNIATHKAGTTATLAASEYRNYPRRIAFQRNTTNNQLLTGTDGRYIPIGINSSGNIATFPYTSTSLPRTTSNNVLLYRTINTSATNLNPDSTKPLFYYPPIDYDGNGSADLDGQPLLVPVLQIHDADSNPASLRGEGNTTSDFRSNWLQQANATTTYNATFVVGNSPSRPDEVSAGLQNLVRFIENWEGKATKISGSFIQLKRSVFATAPLAQIFIATSTTTATATSNNFSLFDYPYDNYPSNSGGSGAFPYYSAPDRNWGFDVGILSEQPDLFAQRFTSPPAGRPNEFFREVGRDDSWVQTLLCAGQASNQTGIATSGTTVTYSAAVPSEYRPSGCPTIPDN